jgi:hypothetical protein
MTNCLSLKRSTTLAVKYNHVAMHKLLYTARSLGLANKHQGTSYFMVFLIPQL